MSRVFVLDKNKEPIAPCTPKRARQLLEKKRAAVYKMQPFTIIMKDREGGVVQPMAYKVDAGSKTTGIALVADYKKGKTVIWAANLEHKGHAVSEKLQSRSALRRGRRSRKTRYRKPKWTAGMSEAQKKHVNQRPKGWLQPSIHSRMDNVVNLCNKLQRLTQVASISFEDVRFDTQLMQNPEIAGVEYQQGTLHGFEAKEYLLLLHRHTCAYCNGISKDPILEVEHIIPRSRKGSDRISNLSIACRTCNENKGNLLPNEWLDELKKSRKKIDKERVKRFSKVAQGIKPALRDAAAMNTMRSALVKKLGQAGLPVELGTGGLTKFNRTKQNYIKEHFVDAACVGESGEKVIFPKYLNPLNIKAVGRGSRQMVNSNKYGFPRGNPKIKSDVFGFRTGDLVVADVPEFNSRGKKNKKVGMYVGRVAVRATGSFNITTKEGRVQGIGHQYCRLLQRNDGYNYSNLGRRDDYSRISSPT